jgi:hypothetical protein
VPKADAGRLSEALDEAINAPRRVREASLRLVESRFRRPAVERAYLDVYRRVIAARTSQRAR